jgi:hypothetical protein
MAWCLVKHRVNFLFYLEVSWHVVKSYRHRYYFVKVDLGTSIKESDNCLLHAYRRNMRCYLTPLSRVLLEKLSVTQLVKRFVALYATPRFITVYKTARTGPYPELDASTPHLPTIPNIHSNTILPSTCRSSKCLFPSGFPTKTLCAFLVSHSPLISSSWTWSPL